VVCAEAEYAYNLRKRIIPLRLEADYKPDGWLGPLCFNNLWYDFSKPENFDEAWSKLNATLNELKQPGCDTCDNDSRVMCASAAILYVLRCNVILRYTVWSIK